MARLSESRPGSCSAAVPRLGKAEVSLQLCSSSAASMGATRVGRILLENPIKCPWSLYPAGELFEAHPWYYYSRAVLCSNTFRILVSYFATFNIITGRRLQTLHPLPVHLSDSTTAHKPWHTSARDSELCSLHTLLHQLLAPRPLKKIQAPAVQYGSNGVHHK
jgi:hypothetical protein